mmetsp:Transcript_29722/g.68640  ORF Transcript_29722/g.68640 Transcript_29722/m.68640 type:complete len:130 (-) Transcript_29722:833-1222(-)
MTHKSQAHIRPHQTLRCHPFICKYEQQPHKRETQVVVILSSMMSTCTGTPIAQTSNPMHTRDVSSVYLCSLRCDITSWTTLAVSLETVCQFFWYFPTNVRALWAVVNVLHSAQLVNHVNLKQMGESTNN